MKKIINIRQNKTSHKLVRRHGDTSSTDQTLNVSSSGRDTVEKALDVTIQTIDALNSLIPIDMAKNILSGIKNVLSLFQKTLQNKDRLKALAQKCEDICSHLALATKGVSSDQMGEALKMALSALESSIHDLHLRIAEALEHGLVHRFAAANLDEKQLVDWYGELDGIFTSFSTKLNIVTVLRLEDIYALLMQASVPNLIPDPPPPAPAMFFGREDLVGQVKAALLRGEDIALIGPGGIGKSSIAKSVIHDEEVMKHYRRRFFVTYDGLDRTVMTFDTFVQRIASALGLRRSGAESGRQVRSNLELSPVLLVLDNAETFEEAVKEDEAKRISDFVSDIAITPGVTVILTSRTRNNARKVRWTRFKVPPLEKLPARQYFREIYSGEIDDDQIDFLLYALDFHPLSIHILAYTAEENEWSGKRLLDEWNTQQGRLLQTGYGKDNLGFTIRLSLSSPSIQVLGDDALHVLWIIAFLPQGIYEEYAMFLFPSLPRISSILDTLCKVSLAHRSGPFLTTLAHIRLFLLHDFPDAGLGLLEGIRDVYYRSLRSLSMKKDPYTHLVVSHHVNIEHLIAFDITYNPNRIQDATTACDQFLFGLANQKTCPTALTHLIPLLPTESEAEKDSKARCLKGLGHLYYGLLDVGSARTAWLDAQSLFVLTGNHGMAAICTSYAAIMYLYEGYFSQTQKILEDFIRSPSWQHIDEEDKQEIYFTLDCSRMYASRDGADRLFLSSMDHWDRGQESRVLHWEARMLHGYCEPQEVERQLKSIRQLCMSSSARDRWSFLSAAAKAAFLQQKLDATMLLLDEAYDSVHGDFLHTLKVLRTKAAVATEQGNNELAESLVQHVFDALGVIATPSSAMFLEVLYIQGRNRLYAKRYTEASQSFSDVIADCHGFMFIRLLSTKALGETEICLGHGTESERYFSQTVGLCREAGIPPELLTIWAPMMELNEERFPGWKRFLQARVLVG